MNISRGKEICKLYREGFTLTEISKKIGIAHSQVVSYLKNYYDKIYDEKYIPFAQSHADFLEDLYNRYKAVYVPGIYTYKQMCDLLGCKSSELIAMTNKYKLNNQWLKTYNGQDTLCNVPHAFKEELKVQAKKHGYKSVRDITVHALVEFLAYLNDKGEC